MVIYNRYTCSWAIRNYYNDKSTYCLMRESLLLVRTSTVGKPLPHRRKCTAPIMHFHFRISQSGRDHSCAVHDLHPNKTSIHLWAENHFSVIPLLFHSIALSILNSLVLIAGLSVVCVSWCKQTNPIQSNPITGSQGRDWPSRHTACTIPLSLSLLHNHPLHSLGYSISKANSILHFIPC